MGAVGLGENIALTPTKLGKSVKILTHKTQLVLTTLLGESELGGSNVLCCDITFDMTLDHIQDPPLPEPLLSMFTSLGTLPTTSVSFLESVLFPQGLKVTP